jgi:catechol 2,3-dioxygenase-like lactoylglutathione lyase family enzyme
MFKLLRSRKARREARTEAGAQSAGRAQTARARFAGGRNIAMRVPAHQFDATLAFYRDALGLPVETMADGTPVVEFGEMRLWLDRSAPMSQAELWLELATDDVNKAAAGLARAGVARCDGVETLPDGFRGFWVVNPAGIVHLVAEPGQDGGDE